MSNCERGQIYIALALFAFGYYHDYGLLVNVATGVLIGSATALMWLK